MIKSLIRITLIIFQMMDNRISNYPPLVHITTLIINQNWIHKQKTRHPSTKDSCYQNLLYKPYRIRTCDQMVTGSVPIRYAVFSGK